MTNQDVDTEYAEAGHTPAETDYYYEETVPLPDGEVIGQEENPVQVKRKLLSDTDQEDEIVKEGRHYRLTLSAAYM